ncbi:MAG: DUF3341 domain-containing protein [Myxococcales bacterium]|nr:DUF3341 domain-containing protein [Myxococcales bacterium]
MREALLAEFGSAEDLARAWEHLRAQGHSGLRTWTPYPVHEIMNRLPDSRIPWVMLAAGVIGGALGYLIQLWCNAIDYPINVGGRPLHSAPAFIPITFESAVLAASVTGFFVLVARCRLPRLHFPADLVEGFGRSAVDRFWLGVVREVDAAAPPSDDDLRAELERLGALRCERVGGPL